MTDLELLPSPNVLRKAGRQANSQLIAPSHGSTGKDKHRNVSVHGWQAPRWRGVPSSQSSPRAAPKREELFDRAFLSHSLTIAQASLFCLFGAPPRGSRCLFAQFSQNSSLSLGNRVRKTIAASLDRRRLLGRVFFFCFSAWLPVSCGGETHCFCALSATFGRQPGFFFPFCFHHPSLQPLCSAALFLLVGQFVIGRCSQRGLLNSRPASCIQPAFPFRRV